MSALRKPLNAMVAMLMPTIFTGLFGCHTPTRDLTGRDPELYARRAKDWRMGPVVYQVLVDRFAPPTNLEAKRALYPAPKRLRAWNESPTRGTEIKNAGVWSHEIDFWGGDLASLRGRLDYIDQLGVDVLYLNPIHDAYTNHKYDALDYFKVSPEYGTRDDVKALAADVHARNMKLVLDGVFNHMGRQSPWFTEAMSRPDNPKRDWFFIGDQYTLGYRGWANVANLPELRLEDSALRGRLWNDADSVVQGYLRDGVDGWRLDVAFDIGFQYLSELTESAHRAKPGSLVVGEIWNYPEEWSPSVDAVMNFHAREIIYGVVAGRIPPGQASRLVAGMVADAGIEPILKAWIILDNHDTRRLKTMLPDLTQRRMAQLLQFTLPGAPCVYYGVELGMEGGDDPEMRGPMPWALATDDNAELTWMRKLTNLRRDNRALRIGDYRWLGGEKLLTFQRRTDDVAETIIVVANPTSETLTETITTRDAQLMNWTWLENLLGGERAQVMSGLVTVELPPRTAWVLRPVIEQTREYSPYKRVRSAR